MLVLTCFGSCITSALLFVTLPSGNLYLVMLNMILFGITVFPTIPLSYSLSVELTFPVNEAMSNGIMIMFS
jgi:hypothetical protein